MPFRLMGCMFFCLNNNSLLIHVNDVSSYKQISVSLFEPNFITMSYFNEWNEYAFLMPAMQSSNSANGDLSHLAMSTANVQYVDNRNVFIVFICSKQLNEMHN